MRSDDDTYDASDRTGLMLHRAASDGHRPHSDNVHLVMVLEGSERGRHIELHGRPVTIGRRHDCDLCLADTCVSKQHCQVSEVGPVVWVSDLNSTNGTFLDGCRINGRQVWREQGTLRIGNQLLGLEYRSRDEVAETERMAEDLKRAADYVRALLPQPLTAGPVLADWCFMPSAVLGGDSFGYYWLDADRFVLYLVDVCGHGTGPAMHSVSVLNVLRQQSLVGVDFGQPSQVLRKLNDAMPMERHGDMFFSVWYGVYRVSERTLTYASGGHPPALLFTGDAAAVSELHTPNLFIGMLPGRDYQQQSVAVPVGSCLCLYSDGVFEITSREGVDWGLADIRELLTRDARTGSLRPDLVYRQVVAVARDGRLEDDFSLAVFQFT